ncbi:MAG: dihydroneopterin aldolase [Rhizobiales bacterium 65-9]|nr:dihydroneopterin aldolase [Hyphomicrobiales bacterium]OJY35361.1 MAG: dihydroneopterin aldolase [Rhizobiales bacterium 65-9]
MTDQIAIKGLLVHARHGVLPHEAKVGQRFAIDMTLAVDLQRAARTDRLADTVSYAAVVVVAAEAFTSRRFKLIEAAAGAVADAVIAAFPPVLEARVTVRKPHAPIAAIFDDVSVTITRRRDG